MKKAEVKKVDELVEGLRDLADWCEVHTELASKLVHIFSHWMYESGGNAVLPTMIDAAEQLPDVTRRVEDAGKSFVVIGHFGPIEVRFHAPAKMLGHAETVTKEVDEFIVNGFLLSLPEEAK